MKLRIPLGAICVLIMFLCLSAPAMAEIIHELHISNRTDLVYNEISGPGKDASFLDKGEHILQEIDLREKDGSKDGWMSVINCNVRGTDTTQYDPLKYSVEKLDFQLGNKRVQINAGDYLANFSQYSMNKSIKGGALQINFKDKQNYLRMAYGIFDGQWEYIFTTIDNEPIDRYGGGFRLQFAGEKYRVGLNLAHVDDIDDDDNRTTQDTYWQNVPSFDWEIRPSFIVLSGEHAYSYTDRHDIAGNVTAYSGHAHKLSLKTKRVLGTKFRIKWERVMPNFYTIGGGATPDRDRTYFKFDTKLGKKFSFFGLANHSKNNISDQSTAGFTTRNTTGELGIKAKKLFGRKSMRLSLSGRKKWVDTSDDSRESTSDRIKFSASDRFVKIIRVKADFETILGHDNVAERGSQDYFYTLQVSSRHRLAGGDWEFKPRFETSIKERESLNGGDDITSEIEADMGVSYKKLLRMGATVSKMQTDLDDIDGNNSKRDKQSLYCEFKPSIMKGGNLKLEASNNDYNFDDFTQDYSERVVKLQIRFDIDSKGEL